MVLWNKSIEYKRSLSLEGLDTLSKKIVDPVSYKRINAFNLFINIILPLVLFFVLKKNLFFLGISFVIFDFICIFIDNLFLNRLPYSQYINDTLEKKQKRLENLNRSIFNLSNKRINYFKKHCSSCRYASYPIEDKECIGCGKDKPFIDKIYYLIKYRDDLNNEVNEELEKIKKESIEKDTRKSADYSDRIDFLQSALERISYFDEKYKIVSLKEITKSLKDLDCTLKKRPYGLQILRGTTITYVDELLNILEKWEQLDDNLREGYISDIEKISKHLGENINALTNRINKMDVQDIDVSIKVLLDELETTKNQEGDGDV